MNRRLRQRHQGLVLGLALLLPVGLALALSSRRAVPKSLGTQAALGPSAPAELPLVSSELWGEYAVFTRLWRKTETRQAIVELTAAEDLALPDVLLYWSASPKQTGRLTGDEFLLGSFFGERTQRYGLPAGEPGGLVLYSLAHNEVVAVANLSELGG